MRRPAPLHEAMMVVRGQTPNHLHLRRRLTYLVGSTLIIDLVCSWLTYGIERNAPRSELHTYGQCLFWTTTQLLTVSSQLVNPVTGRGMWLDVAMEFLGITVVAALAGSLGSFLYRRSLELSPLHPKLSQLLERFEGGEKLDRDHAQTLPAPSTASTGSMPPHRPNPPDAVSGSATPSG